MTVNGAEFTLHHEEGTVAVDLQLETEDRIKKFPKHEG